MTEGAGAMSSRWKGCRAVEADPLLAGPASSELSHEAAVEEQEWIRRCQEGDETAFRELLRRYRPRALYLAAQILRDWNEAEDVVQEAFLRVFHSIRRFRGEAAFFSWLYRIVVNLCLDRGRRAGAQPALPIDEEWDQRDASEWSETRLHIDELLAQLSDELRITLLLREVVGLSYVEIAEELEIPIGTVRSRLNAAREQFRRLWEKDDER